MEVTKGDTVHDFARQISNDDPDTAQYQADIAIITSNDKYSDEQKMTELQKLGLNNAIEKVLKDNEDAKTLYDEKKNVIENIINDPTKSYTDKSMEIYNLIEPYSRESVVDNRISNISTNTPRATAPQTNPSVSSNSSNSPEWLTEPQTPQTKSSLGSRMFSSMVTYADPRTIHKVYDPKDHTDKKTFWVEKKTSTEISIPELHDDVKSLLVIVRGIKNSYTRKVSDFLKGTAKGVTKAVTGAVVGTAALVAAIAASPIVGIGFAGKELFTSAMANAYEGVLKLQKDIVINTVRLELNRTQVPIFNKLGPCSWSNALIFIKQRMSTSAYFETLIDQCIRGNKFQISDTLKNEFNKNFSSELSDILLEINSIPDLSSNCNEAVNGELDKYKSDIMGGESITYSKTMYTQGTKSEEITTITDKEDLNKYLLDFMTVKIKHAICKSIDKFAELQTYKYGKHRAESKMTQHNIPNIKIKDKPSNTRGWISRLFSKKKNASGGRRTLKHKRRQTRRVR